MSWKIYDANGVFGPEWSTVRGTTRPFDVERLRTWMQSMENVSNSKVDRVTLHDNAITELDKRLTLLSDRVERLQNFMNWVGMNHPEVMNEYATVLKTKERIGVDGV